MAAVVNDYKFSGQKEYTFVILQFWRSEVWNRAKGGHAMPAGLGPAADSGESISLPVVPSPRLPAQISSARPFLPGLRSLTSASSSLLCSLTLLCLPPLCLIRSLVLRLGLPGALVRNCHLRGLNLMASKKFLCHLRHIHRLLRSGY